MATIGMSGAESMTQCARTASTAPLLLLAQSAQQPLLQAPPAVRCPAEQATVAPRFKTPICVKQYSLVDYTEVASCTTSSNNLCMSGQCAQAGNGTNYCVPQAKNNKSIPQVCTVASECLTGVNSRIGQAWTSTCACGMSTKGTQYCGLFPGDSYYPKFIASEKLWMATSNYTNCNLNVPDPTCAASQWTSNSDRSKYLYYSFMAVRYDPHG